MHHTRTVVAFARWNFLLPAANKKYNNAAKLILPLKQNTSEGFTDELINLLCENEMISMSGAWDKEKI